MKRFIWLYVLLFLTVSLGFILSVIMAKPPSQNNTDMLAVNTIINSVRQNRNNIEKLSGMSFAYDFIFVDNTGECLFKTTKDMPDSLYDAVKLGFITMDVTVGHQTIGKVPVDTRRQEGLTRQFSQHSALVFAAYLLISAVLLVIFLWLYATVIHPFKKLSGFAKNIAGGLLDTPLPMDRSNVFGAFSESFDIMRASLIEARHNEQLANQSKKELITALSHDIKNPVTSIRLICELLQAQISDTGQLCKLKTIESKTEQIDHLMSNLLQSTLNELGQLSVVVTDENSAVLHNLIENLNIDGQTQTAQIPSYLVRLDVCRMEQVIGNIISNAAKYAGTTIDVKGTLSDEFLLVDFMDYGAGVDTAEIPYLCNRYFRGACAIDSRKQGEGLGLYISKLLMNMMDGDLECFNRDDGFTVRLLIRLSS